MKISWSADYVGRHLLHAAPHDYDGVPPISALLIDERPKVLSPDREAVAGALVFGRYAAGTFEFPRKFSPAVASAIEVYCGGSWVSPGPIEYYPKALPEGSRRAVLQSGGSLDRLASGPDGAVNFSVLRSDTYSGALLSLGAFAIASNAWLHGELGGGLERLTVPLAVGGLFAEDLLIDEFFLPATVGWSTEEESAIRRLLGACRLGLVIGGQQA